MDTEKEESSELRRRKEPPAVRSNEHLEAVESCLWDENKNKWRKCYEHVTDYGRVAAVQDGIKKRFGFTFRSKWECETTELANMQKSLWSYSLLGVY